MSDKFESARLILKLYDLRREARMREARDWFMAFMPDSVEDVLAAWRGEHSAKYRMVTSYWDMAASLVNNGAVDAHMFHDAGMEQMYVYAKLEPYLEGMREQAGVKNYLSQLEKLIKNMPDADARLATVRGRIAKMKEARAAAAK